MGSIQSLAFAFFLLFATPVLGQALPVWALSASPRVFSDKVLDRKAIQNLNQGSRDLSEDFQNILEDSKALHTMKKYKFILVRGFLADYFDYIDKNFATQVEIFSEMGMKPNLDFEVANTDTEAESEINAADIVKAIRDSQKPVILVSHSKGSVDVLYALLTYPELQNKVKGWISVQGAIRGTRLADNLTDPKFVGTSPEDFLKHPFRAVSRWFIDLLISWSSGDSEVLYSLRTDVRELFLAENEEAIRELVSKIPTLSVGSWQSYGRLNYFLRKQLEVMVPNAPLSDGVIEPMRAVVPGSSYVILDDVSHIDLVPSRSPYNRRSFTLRLLDLFWKQVAAPTQ
ncbi:MAG: hypothetical protein KDD33_04640 [Bdellovibrionales bacterium]|nr:hypothetical protein [Bdellovibrionales bacterium]